MFRRQWFKDVAAPQEAEQVLHHAEGPGHMLREMTRVVKPGGVTEMVDEVKHPLAWMRDEHADV